MRWQLQYTSCWDEATRGDESIPRGDGRSRRHQKRNQFSTLSDLDDFTRFDPLKVAAGVLAQLSYSDSRHGINVAHAVLHLCHTSSRPFEDLLCDQRSLMFNHLCDDSGHQGQMSTIGTNRWRRPGTRTWIGRRSCIVVDQPGCAGAGHPVQADVAPAEVGLDHAMDLSQSPRLSRLTPI